MDNIKKHLTSAKHTREKFMKFWKGKNRNTEQLIKFLDYPWELQLGTILEFLFVNNISIFIYNQTYDLLLIKKPDKLPDFVLEEKHGLYFICFNTKLMSSNIMQNYLVACVTAINWINFKEL